MQIDMTKINYTLDTNDSPFANLLSFAEAAELWMIDQSTLRKAVQDGRLVPGRDCRKFGKQWVISVDAMARVFKRAAGPYDYTPWSRFLCELRKAEKSR